MSVYKETDKYRSFFAHISSPKILFPSTVYAATYQEWSKSLSGSSSCYRNIRNILNNEKNLEPE